MVEFTAARINEAEKDEYWSVLVFRDVQDGFLAERQGNVAISQLATAARIAYQMLIAVNLTKNTYYMLEYERFPVQEPRVSGSFDSLIEAELSTVHPDCREEALEHERRAKQLLEDALQKAEKASQAKSDFLSRMSHDIRTPMNAILGMTELAQLCPGDREKVEDYLKKIRSSGIHLLGLINGVLAVGKIESGNFALEETEFDLQNLVRESVEIVRFAMEQRNQSITVEYSESLASKVTGDEQRLMQILVNILDNASKYTPNGGTIIFRLEELDRGEQKTGGYRFVIADNGIGMKPEYLEHIFEPFSRASDSRTSEVTGTGLGMTIVKNLVTMMGGDIRVKSEYGKCTRFTVTLCLEKNEAWVDEAQTVEWKKETDFSGLNILLAEDNKLNRQIAVEMLTLLGARVEVAENGRQAVDAVRSHPPMYYDLVFMDIQMSVLNGYDATREIRGSGMEGSGELMITAMTADAFAEDARQANLAGMNGHLAKPISMEELRDELSKCLAWKQTK